ncbi:MAG: metallophosphoesterase [Tannerella sp.]|nr:metallophosphoesterase [Tannerella sp.]
MKTGAGLLTMSVLPTAAREMTVQDIALNLPPYLQNPAQDGMTVMWHTADPSYSWVEYGVSTNESDLQTARAVEHGIVSANITRHKVRLTGLVAETKYYYRICSRKVIKYQAYSKELGPTEHSPFYSFTTFGDAPKDFTCLIFTDLHNNVSLYDKLMDRVGEKGFNFDFAVFNGDIFEDPATDNQVLTLIARYNNRADASNKPVIYLRGNHEIRGAYAMQLPAFFDLPEDETYFAFTFGDTRFVFLDNGEDKNDSSAEYFGLVDFDGFRQRETEWLQHEITSTAFTSAYRKVLIHHIPLYGYSNNFDPGFFPCKDLWDPIFRSTPFDVDITGHLHSFSFKVKNVALNPFPQAVGGGPTEANGRVMILTKRGDALTLRSMDCNGNIQTFPIYSENVTLTGITLSGGMLEPAFDPQVTTYKILVTSQICSLSLSGTPSSTSAVVTGTIKNKPCTVGETISLKVVSEDGTEKIYRFTVTYSNVRNATVSDNIYIYPNPVRQGSMICADLNRSYDRLTVKILNTAGQTVRRYIRSGQRIRIPATVPAGVYFLAFDSNEMKSETKFKIIIT